MILSGYYWSCPFPSPPALLCLFLSSFLAVPTALHLLKWHTISIHDFHLKWDAFALMTENENPDKVPLPLLVWNRDKDLHRYLESSVNTARELETPHKTKLRFVRPNYAPVRQKGKAWESAGFWLLHRRWTQGTISRTERDALGGSGWWWSLHGDTTQGWRELKESATEVWWDKTTTTAGNTQTCSKIL